MEGLILDEIQVALEQEGTVNSILIDICSCPWSL